MNTVDTKSIEFSLSRVRADAQVILHGWEDRALEAANCGDLGSEAFVIGRSLMSIENRFLPEQGVSEYFLHVQGLELAAIKELTTLSAGHPSAILRQRGSGEVATFVFNPKADDANVYGFKVQYLLDVKFNEDDDLGLVASTYEFSIALTFFNGVL